MPNFNPQMSPVVEKELAKILSTLMVEGQLRLEITLKVIPEEKPVAKTDTPTATFGFGLMDPDNI